MVSNTLREQLSYIVGYSLSDDYATLQNCVVGIDSIDELAELVESECQKREEALLDEFQELADSSGQLTTKIEIDQFIASKRHTKE